MERQRNWVAWAALALAGLALLVAFSGRFAGPRMMAHGYGSAAPAAPRFEEGRGGPPAWAEGRGAERFEGRGEHFHGRGEGFGPGAHGRDRGFGGLFGPLGMIFGLLNALFKLAALGLLVWLLVRLFQQRRNGTPPPTPMTPAGHDPRVE